jgi:hypothetical protein
MKDSLTGEMMKRPFMLRFTLRILLPVTIGVNMINWRFGRPYCCSGETAALFRTRLQPGMVILTHKKYELSSVFIPGYWTHSALVLSSGSILEAVGNGVCVKTTDAFFAEIDDFIVLKPKFCKKSDLKHIWRQATNFIGLPYSFDFSNTSEKVYCSGLICQVFIRVLTETGHLHHLPSSMGNFLKGRIIIPGDIRANQEAWQVMHAR